MMRIATMVFVIISLTVVAYSNSLGGDFIWDDNSFVVNNDIIKSWRNFPVFFTRKEALAEGNLAGENYRPLVVISYAIDYSLWKLNPMGYHIVNTLFHICNALLLFWIISAILRDRYAALLSSLFFALHPILTETVAWISGRSGVLFLFFYLLSFGAYIHNSERKNIYAYSASIVSFACALLSREMSASLPLILILYDYYFGKEEKIIKRIIRYLPYFLLLEIYIFLRFDVLGRLGQTAYWGGGLYPTALTMAKGIFQYVKLLAFPLRQCADYSNMRVSYSIFSPGVIFSISMLAIIFIAALSLKKYSRHASFFCAWFFITILPVSNIIPIKIIIAERFLYLPSIGFSVLCSMVIVRIYNFRKFMPGFFKFFSVMIAASLISFYAVRTSARNSAWVDEEIFFKKILEYDPLTTRALTNLAVLYMDENKLDEAEDLLKKAIYIVPNFITARDNRAIVYFAKGKYQDMMNEFDAILNIDPFYVRAYEYRGLFYAFDKKYDKAIIEYKKAITLDPDFLYAYYDIGRVYEAQKLYQNALAEYEKILERKGVFHKRAFLAGVSLRIGEIYYMQGDEERAYSQWNKTIKAFPDEGWASDLARFMSGEISFQAMEKKLETWQARLRMIGFYYMGLKSEMEKDYENAKKFYKNCLDLSPESLGHMRLLAEEKLRLLE